MNRASRLDYTACAEAFRDERERLGVQMRVIDEYAVDIEDDYRRVVLIVTV